MNYLCLSSLETKPRSQAQAVASHGEQDETDLESVEARVFSAE